MVPTFSLEGMPVTKICLKWSEYSTDPPAYWKDKGRICRGIRQDILPEPAEGTSCAVSGQAEGSDALVIRGSVIRETLHVVLLDGIRPVLADM